MLRNSRVEWFEVMILPAYYSYIVPSDFYLIPRITKFNSDDVVTTQ